MWQRLQVVMQLRMAPGERLEAGEQPWEPNWDTAVLSWLRMAPGECLEAGEQPWEPNGHSHVLLSCCPAVLVLVAAQPGHSSPGTQEPHPCPVRAHQAREVALFLSRAWISDAARLEDPSSPKGAALQGGFC